jgi:hypothetical protein
LRSAQAVDDTTVTIEAGLENHVPRKKSTFGVLDVFADVEPLVLIIDFNYVKRLSQP